MTGLSRGLVAMLQPWEAFRSWFFILFLFTKLSSFKIKLPNRNLDLETVLEQTSTTHCLPTLSTSIVILARFAFCIKAVSGCLYNVLLKKCKQKVTYLNAYFVLLKLPVLNLHYERAFSGAVIKELNERNNLTPKIRN